jgi:very-short-patch-repair endonuclease
MQSSNFQTSNQNLYRDETIFDEVFTNHRFDEQKHFKEIDIFIKDINLAIEYDGATFHKNKELDLEKNNLIKNADLHFIIFPTNHTISLSCFLG